MTQNLWKTSPELWLKLKPLAQEMRREPTAAENILWQRLRRKSLSGYKIRRQHPFDRFIVDFYCAETRLVIEVDGVIHEQTQEYDAVRQEFLEYLGLRVLRFTNGEVMQNTDAVLERIGEILDEHSHR